MRKEHTYYIDGLKGIAAIMILISHYSGIYKYAQSIPHINNGLKILIMNSPFKVFIDENVWLCLFLVLSGYVLCIKPIENFSKLIIQTIKRFFRFILPIYGAVLIIYMIYICFGFWNVSTTKILQNEWLQNFYTLPINAIDILIDPIKTVLLSGSIFNSPYWVISRMFYGSIVVYLCNFIIAIKPKSKILILAIAAIVSACFLSYIGLGCVCGMAVRLYQNSIKFKHTSLCYLIFIFSLIMIYGLHDIIYDSLSNLMDLPVILDFNSYWAILYISIILLTLDKMDNVKHFLSNQLFLKLSEISFGIYSLHWPIMCSFGCAIILLFYNQMNFTLLLILSLVITITITCIISIIYRFTVEKYSSVFTNKIDIYLNNKIEKLL